MFGYIYFRVIFYFYNNMIYVLFGGGVGERGIFKV